MMHSATTSLSLSLIVFLADAEVLNFLIVELIHYFDSVVPEKRAGPLFYYFILSSECIW
jgi:hypothetical protein